MKMALCELLEKVRETEQKQMPDRPLLLFGHFFSPRAGPRLSYFLLMCEKMTPHEVKYMFHFEDDFGNVLHKEINRPEVRPFLYEHLPLINENNKQHQNLH